MYGIVWWWCVDAFVIYSALMLDLGLLMHKLSKFFVRSIATEPLLISFTVCTLQQVLDRLRCFPIQPVLSPTLLSDRPEDQTEGEYEEQEPEAVEELETEELMRSMASKLSPATRFRWRRSRWLRYCPVALADGKLVPGKAEFTVSYVSPLLFFLDFVWLVSFSCCMLKEHIFWTPAHLFLASPIPQ